MGLQQRKMRQQLEGTIKAARRDGYNRGIRAALKVIESYPPSLGRINLIMAFRELLKPPVSNPNFMIKK